VITTREAFEGEPRVGLHDLREIVHDLWHSRELLFQLTLRDIRVRYKQAVMGFAWAILNPLLIVAAGLVVRVSLLNMAGAQFDVSSATAVVTKGLAWAFFSGSVGFATNALTNNGALIAKIYFPRETLPLSAVLASTFDSLVAVAAVAVVLPFTGWRPTSAVVWVPMLAVLLFALTLAIGLLASCANLFFRDVKYIVQLLISFGIFFTPVFYEPAVLGAGSITLQMLNPLAGILEGLRLSIADGHNLWQPLVAADGGVVWSPLFLLYSATWALGGLVVSAVIFHRAQFRFAEYL
jgi:lipopolysaccharide transport system permease protein